MTELRHCTKCQSRQPIEGGTGKGRQYRCRICTEGRANRFKPAPINHAPRAEEAMARYKAFIEQCRDLFVIGADLPALKTRTKGEHSPTQTLIRRCLKAGLIFSDHRGSATRYFLNFEDMEIARKKFDAAVVEHKRAKRALRNKTRRVVSKSAPAMPQTYVKRVTAAGAAFKAQTAHRPAHVKVQRCPAGIDQRFTPCEPFEKYWGNKPIGTYL